jgi:hypothetical protein
MSDTQFIRKFAGRDVDIRDIEKQFTNKDGTFKNPRGIKGAKVLGFEWLNIEGWDETDSRLTNICVRATQNLDETDKIQSSSSIAFDFEQHGWRNEEFPPEYEKSTGKLPEGRTRILGAISNGEKWIPVAIISKSEAKWHSVNGLRGNNHKVSKRLTMDDVIMNVVNDVKTGVVADTDLDIEEQLYTNIEIGSMFPQGHCTQIYNKVIALLAESSVEVFNAQTSYWKEYGQKWLAKNKHIGIDKFNDIILFKAGNTAPHKMWINNIMPKYLSNVPSHIILYVQERNSDAARDMIKNTIADLAKIHDDTFELVNKRVGDMMTVNTPDEKIYTVQGVMPQLLNKKHKALFGDKLLIQPEDY